ncbi:MAG: hypothetical protein ABIG37_01315 [Nanoarchaeota archaeon]
MDVDLYEFQGTLKKFEEDKFIEFSEEKAISLIEVGKTNRGIDKKLKEKGYKKGDKVLVVIQ